MLAYAVDKLSFCLFWHYMERLVEGTIGFDYPQVGGKHDKRFTYCLHDALSIFLSFLKGFLCSLTLGDLSLQYFASLLYAPLRGIKLRPKLFHLKERFLLCLEVCFGFSFYNITYHPIGLRSLGFITKTYDKLKRVPRNA